MFNSQLGFYRNLSDTCASLHDADDTMVTRLHALVVQVLPDRNVSLMVSSTSGVALRTARSVGRFTREGLAEDDGYWRALSVVGT